MGEQSYVTSAILLQAGIPQRVAQDATSFSIISATNVGAITVSLTQGGFGALPAGISLELPELSPLYVLSTITQSVTIAYATGGVILRDSRTGSTDANGNLLVQTGASANPTFLCGPINALPGGGVTNLLCGIYGGGKVATIKRLRAQGIFGPAECYLARFTGSPAASGTIYKMSSGDSATRTLSTNVTAGFVVTDIILPSPIPMLGPNGSFLDFEGLGIKCPQATATEGIGIFEPLGTGIIQYDTALVWTES